MIPKIIKRNYLRLICVIALMLILIKAPTECHGFEIAINVAPNTLNIESSRVVTVHTDILYDTVVGHMVTLNRIPIQSYKWYSRGYFVAKFSMIEVEALVDERILELGEVTLTLVGHTDDDVITGSQTITVISIEPEGAGEK